MLGLILASLMCATEALPEYVAKLVPRQRPAASEVLLKLGSPEASERAWGAFYAGVFEMTEARDALLQL